MLLYYNVFVTALYSVDIQWDKGFFVSCNYYNLLVAKL